VVYTLNRGGQQRATKQRGQIVVT